MTTASKPLTPSEDEDPRKRVRIQAALEAIAESHQGRLTPGDVVDNARDPSSALHAEFEWDDQKAAHDHRLEQARRIIRSIRVEVVVEERVIKAPFFVRDATANPDEQGYVKMLSLRGDADRARETVIAELTRASAMVARARDVASAIGMEVFFDETQTSIEKLRQMVDEASEATEQHVGVAGFRRGGEDE